MMKTMFGFVSAPRADDSASAEKKSAAAVLLSKFLILEVNPKVVSTFCPEWLSLMNADTPFSRPDQCAKTTEVPMRR